jgi:hypothetical protein
MLFTWQNSELKLMSDALLEEAAIVAVVSAAALITITQARDREPYTTSSLTSYCWVLEPRVIEWE